MQQDLQLAGMAERTAEAYIRAVRKLAAYTGKSPDLIDEEELRAYFYYIRNDQLWEPSTIRGHLLRHQVLLSAYLPARLANTEVYAS